MGWFTTLILVIIVVWLLYGLFDMYRNKDKSLALMKMALNTGRKEGVEIRKSIDKTIKQKK